MPPPRIAGWAREPRLTASLPPVSKDAGGYGANYSGFGFGAWGFLPGSTGLAVTPYAALQVATAWACVKRIAEDNAKLRREVRQKLPNAGTRILRDHPIHKLLSNPNPWMGPTQCWGYMSAWLAQRGNTYAVVERGEAGEPTAIIPVSSDRVSVMVSPAGELYYQISHPYFGVAKRLHRDNVIHVRGLISFDGYTGIGPIAAAQDVFGLGIATQQHGAVLFRQGASVNGFIKHPGKLSNDAKANLAEGFDQRHTGVQRAHRTGVLDEGMSFEKITMTNEEAQFLASRQFTVPEICRMFGVPPHKVHDLSNAHFNNLEQSELAYRSDTLLPIGKQFKEECGRVLLWEDEQADIEIDVNWDDLLRADKLTRYQTYQIGLNNGIINRNEARIDDGREPVPDGNEFRVPLNTGASGDNVVKDPPWVVSRTPNFLRKFI
jgi:HK97 family phage portal protein